MSKTTKEVLDAALELPVEARAFLAERLLESLDAMPGEKLSPAWQEEIQRRCREIDGGLVELRDGAEVFDEAYRALG